MKCFFYGFLVICHHFGVPMLFSAESITNPSRVDGFGAQFQSVIATAVYAELSGKKFLYTPFTAMEHNYDHSVDFLLKKEVLINFLGNFDLNSSGDVSEASIWEMYKYLEDRIEDFSQSESLQKIKSLFREGKKKRSFFDDEHMHVAVHVRRPNSHDSRIQGADVLDATYLSNIQWVRELYKEKNVIFHIYSQGKESVFSSVFDSPDIVLHINESVEDTFTGMVLADALMTAPSSLSYVAGMLSEGTVFYFPFWHKPFPHWIEVPNSK